MKNIKPVSSKTHRALQQRDLLSNDFIKDINPENPLGTGGYLAGAVAELTKDLWLEQKRAVAPWKFKKVISKFAP